MGVKPHPKSTITLTVPPKKNLKTQKGVPIKQGSLGKIETSKFFTSMLNFFRQFE